MPEAVEFVGIGPVESGLTAAAAPWFLDGQTTAGAINGSIAGCAVALSALPRGPKREAYGPFDRTVK